jgi:hypothetical protein
LDTSNGGFNLNDSLPCIGVGIDPIEISGICYYCPIIDLEGNPRPNPSGSMTDMGVYKYEYPVELKIIYHKFPRHIH